MARSAVHPTHEFDPWQTWPGSYDNPKPTEQFSFPGQAPFRVDRQTAVASMGSCFAREIKKVLVERGYNYVQEEPGHPRAVHGSAAWERVYNTACMRQIFEYSFGDWQPERRWWVCPQSNQVQDPYRRTFVYDSMSTAEADFANHRQCSRRALERAEVLILTLGLVEIWRDEVDGSVISLPSGPYVKEGGDMTRYRFHVSRCSEVLDDLERIRELLDRHNPRCRLLLTVSPNHLWATFREDRDVMSASCNSKSTLRAAADEFCARHEDAHYYPAYEIATMLQPMLGRPIHEEGPENFHVNPATVPVIMDNFFRYFDGSEPPAASEESREVSTPTAAPVELTEAPAAHRFDRIAEIPEATKLHLGCGRTILEGWLNLDREALPGVDVVADLDACRSRRLPLDDDSVDIIFASHLLEHIRDPLALMEELWRIARPGAIVRVKTPYGSSDSAFEDPTHVRQYFVQSHQFFSQPCYWRADYGYRGDWQPRTVLLAMEEERWQGRLAEEVWEAVMERRNVVREMTADLEAIKPRRPASRELIEKPRVHINLF